MAKKPKVLIGFSRLKDLELMATTETIIAAMTDNPNYPMPLPALTAIESLNVDFSNRLESSMNGTSKTNTALKKECRIALIQGLQHLGHYVNSEAGNKLSKLLSSGFPMGKATTGSLVPLPLDNVRLSDGRQSRQLRLDFKRQKNAMMYEYRYRPLKKQKWIDHLFTTSSRGNIIAGLEIAKFYEVQVRAINRQGAGDWSKSATLLVR